MRVDDSRIRKEKVADSKISGYVWTWPELTVCQNFSGPFRVPQFPLYLCNAEVVSHENGNPLRFPYIKNMLKGQLFKTSGLTFDN